MRYHAMVQLHLFGSNNHFTNSMTPSSFHQHNILPLGVCVSDGNVSSSTFLKSEISFVQESGNGLYGTHQKVSLRIYNSRNDVPAVLPNSLSRSFIWFECWSFSQLQLNYLTFHSRLNSRRVFSNIEFDSLQ